MFSKRKNSMTLVEIEKTVSVDAVMSYRTPAWHFPAYENGRNGFSWMGDGKLGRNPVTVGSVTVNGVSYRKYKGISDPALVPQLLSNGDFCQIGNTVYVKPANNNPLWARFRLTHTAVLGFTDEKSCVIEGIFYRTGLDYVPQRKDEADSLEYGRMKFSSENIVLQNTKGEYDAAACYFGNNVRVKSLINGELIPLYEYYVKNIKIKEDKTTFVCGDRREKLLQKVPNKRFTVDEYPFMKPELEGEAMQDAYGRCEWVKCVCVDELKIYEDDTETLKRYRTFYAARKIYQLQLTDTRPNKNNRVWGNYVWVKQTQPDDGTEAWTPCEVQSVPGGCFTLKIEFCMPPTFVGDDGHEGWEGDDVPEVYEVRACGLFGAYTYDDEISTFSSMGTEPLDIIIELLNHYCGIPWIAPAGITEEEWDGYCLYDRDEMKAELDGLAPVGIVYDDEISVFEAIEKLQNASDYGFRFIAKYNQFTARKDDNLRPPLEKTIKITDIVNIGKAELDMRADNYATIVDIAYKRDYYRDTASHYAGTANQEALLNAHGVDKTHAPETYLTRKADAEKKAEMLEAFFRKNRIMIKNLEVLNCPKLRVYDIVLVDLRIPLERKSELKQIAGLFGTEGAMKKESVIYGGWPGEKITADFGEADNQPDCRAFGGILTCKVMSVNLDLDTMVNTLDLLEVGNE
jgi:hypothetical protein